MFRYVAIALVWACILPASAAATPVFKFDTTYEISGTFNWGEFGKLTIQDGSFLHYDSVDELLTIELSATSNKYQGGTFELSFLLGEAEKKGGKTVFDYAPGANKKNGLTQLGLFTPEFSFSLPGKRNVTAGSEFMIFSTGMNPFINVVKNQLVFQSWVAVWGTNPKFDLGSDPKFYLTEAATPPNEIPEPFTFGLLASGLVGGAFIRRKQRH